MSSSPELFNGPPAIDQTGNHTIWAVQDIADINAPTLAEIALGDRITYSFGVGGYALGVSQAKNSDPRHTGIVDGESLGKITPTFSDLTYVDSDDIDSAAFILNGGGIWHFVDRRNVSQLEEATADDLVRVIEVDLGPQLPGPTGGDGKFNLMQAAAIVRLTLEPVAIVAA